MTLQHSFYVGNDCINEVHMIAYFSYSPHKEPIQRMVYLKNTNRYLAISKVCRATEMMAFYLIFGATYVGPCGARCVSMWHYEWFHVELPVVLCGATCGAMWSYVWFHVELQVVPCGVPRDFMCSSMWFHVKFHVISCVVTSGSM